MSSPIIAKPNATDNPAFQRMRDALPSPDIKIGRTLVANPAIPLNSFSNEALGIPKEFAIIPVQVPDNAAPHTVKMRQTMDLQAFRAANVQGHIVYQWLDDSMITADLKDARNKVYNPSVTFINGLAVIQGCYIAYTWKSLLMDSREANIAERQSRVMKARQAKSQNRAGRVHTDSYSIHESVTERITLADLFKEGVNNVFPELSQKDIANRMEESEVLPSLDVDY